MKTSTTFLSGLMISLMLFSGCKKDDDKIDPIDETPTVSVGTIVSSVALGGTFDADAYSHYAYVCRNQEGLSVVDLSNPASPQLTTTLNPAGELRDGFVYADKLYIAAYGEGVYAYSLSNPAYPSQLLHFVPGDETSYVFVNDNYIFAAGGISSNGYLSIHDLSTGALVGAYNNTATDETDRGFQSLYVSGNYVYAGTAGGCLYILDITNPASPAFISRYYNPGTLGHSPWLQGIAVSNNVAYMADWGAGTISVDVSNPALPTELDVFTGGTDGPQAYDIKISGTTAYVANGWGGLLVLDITNPSAITLKFEVNPSSSSYLGVSLMGDYALVADNGQQKLSVIKVK
ncbi:MAG: hypothetical protein CVU11_15175 [Bacteroidetes bacterium HGW-Bacteroidetes-6]|jgi:hypothetical protein|nr:MAG: hypothetical protein CVU11_15175 [Bacteroidetes bacterium HGW-Bacteroidetes-6]